MLLSMKDIAAFKALDLPQEDFQFSAVLDETAHKILDTAPLQDFLNQNISLNRYGTVRHIGFTPTAIQGDSRHQSIAYNEDEASIGINLQLDYGLVEKAGTKSEMTATLARYFLAAIPLFTEVPVPNFRITAFRNDVLDLFQQKDWLDAPLPLVSSPSIYLVWMSDFRDTPLDENPSVIFARKIARREWYDAIDIEGLTKWLYQRIDLSRYGTGIKELYLSFLADEPGGKTMGPSSTYFREDRELHLSIPLGPPPYGRQTLLKALAEALPQADRWDIEDFDWKGVKGCI